MSDALPLPPQPSLDQYKKLATELQRAGKSNDSGAVRDWAARWMEAMELLKGPEAGRQIRREAEHIQRRWSKFKETEIQASRLTLSSVQLFLAREHGFASWATFVEHIKAMTRTNSPVSKFESAVDAIVDGDPVTLDKLLRDNPELVLARSTREHRSTLLHYVSANGVEDFRQKTPQNIVEITTLLLKAGAGVNAESDAYGGRSTTLGLTATSCHPEQTGAQIPLLELLIKHGAMIDPPNGGSVVNDCLHNGRGEAAEFLASRGARLDLEGAAGVGRLDVVKSFFADDGSLKSTATEKQLQDGFASACGFGRTSVVEFLMQTGLNVGQTGLHWAAFSAHVEIVKLLLARGARVDVKDEFFDSTALEWALYAWGIAPAGTDPENHYEAVALLTRAGARLDPQWYDGNEDRLRVVEKVRSDARMVAALGGLPG